MSINEAISLLAGADCTKCKYNSDWSEPDQQNFVCTCEERLKTQGHSYVMVDKLDVRGWCEYYKNSQ